MARLALLSHEPGAHDPAVPRARRYGRDRELAPCHAARQRCLGALRAHGGGDRAHPPRAAQVPSRGSLATPRAPAPGRTLLGCRGRAFPGTLPGAVVLQGALRTDGGRSKHDRRRPRAVQRHLRRERVGVELKALLEVRGKDPSRRRKGRVLAIMLLGMLAGMLTVATYNAFYAQSQYYVVNGVFILLLVGLLVLNRLGFVYLAGLSTVALTGVGSLVLIGDQLSAAFITMPIPILIASSLLAPWAGFIVAAIMIIAAAVFHVATLGLLTLLIVAIISYLFADSLERAYRESRHQALHDPLTDLPNRALFLDRLEQELVSAERAGRVVAVLFIDLDNFKVINDSLGHHLGDRLLVEVSRRLSNGLRPRDSAARFGGDEFTILLTNLWDAGGAVRVTKRLLEALHEPFVIGNHEVAVSASVGIALGNVDTARPSDLLRNADTALYRAKGTKGRYELFRPKMHTQNLKRLKLEEDLRQSIEWGGGFEVHYQPQVTLETRTIAEMEALVRWGHPRRGLVMPSEFIQVTEETGLIVPI